MCIACVRDAGRRDALRHVTALQPSAAARQERTGLVLVLALPIWTNQLPHHPVSTVRAACVDLRTMSSDGAIDDLFSRAVSIAQSLPPAGPLQTSYDEKLALYGLYKQAAEGDVSVPRPRLLDVLGRAKWDAWAKCCGVGKRDAKRLYVEAMLHTLRRYRDRPQARALIDELENFSGRVVAQAMHSDLFSGDDASGPPFDDDLPANDLGLRASDAYRRPLLPQGQMFRFPSDASRHSSEDAEQGDQHKIEVFTAMSDPSRTACSRSRLEAAARSSVALDPSMAIAATESTGPTQLSAARPELCTDERMYGISSRLGAEPASESHVGRAAEGFCTPSGSLYTPPGAAAGVSSNRFVAASPAGGGTTHLPCPQQQGSRAQGQAPAIAARRGERLPRTTDPGLHYLASAITSQQADAVDLALQRIQASLAELHDRMAAVEQRASFRNVPKRSQVGPSSSPSIGCRGNGGATGALAQLWRALANTAQDIGILLGLSTGTGGSGAPYFVAASGARRVGHGGAANARTVRDALGNIFFSAPLRILLAMLYLAVRVALDALSIGLVCTGLLFLARRLSGRGDPLLILRAFVRATRALRARGAAQAAAVSATTATMASTATASVHQFA